MDAYLHLPVEVFPRPSRVHDVSVHREGKLSMNRVLLLLAEDEPMIQFALREVLEDSGYEVMTADDGQQALTILEERHSDIAGLVTDIRLGQGPDGWQVAHRARELVQTIAVVYMTGDSAARWMADGVPESLVLQKPFADAQLVTSISTLMNAASLTIAKSPPPPSE